MITWVRRGVVSKTRWSKRKAVRDESQRSPGLEKMKPSGQMKMTASCAKHQSLAVLKKKMDQETWILEAPTVGRVENGQNEI